MRKPFVGRLLQKLARRAGVRAHLEPRYGFVGQILLPRGRKSYFRNTNFDLNPLGAAEIAKDKDYAAYFMRQMGYRTVPGKTFFRGEFARALGSTQNIHAAYRYAKKLGFPVIVKPNSLSKGVAVGKVFNKKEFYAAARHVFQKDSVMLVQKFVRGADYRIVALDNRVIASYRREPLSVVGDGRSHILSLLTKKQRKFIGDGRDTIISLNDFRIAQRLTRMRLSLRAVPKKGERITLLDNANLSSGGEAEDVTRMIHPFYKKLAVRLTRDIGLRFCGVDMIVEGEITKPPRCYWILEVNAAPGLDYYAAGGRKQERIVENLYLQVLKALKRHWSIRL